MMQDDDNEDEDQDQDNYEIEKKIENLQRLFCESILEEISLNRFASSDDIEEAILYFSSKEEFEKCIKLKKALKKNKKYV